MKIVGYIFAACFLLTILQSFVAAGMVMFALAVVWGAFFRPRQTVGLFATLTVFGLVGTYPLASIVVAGLAFVAIKLGRKPGDGAAGAGAAASPPLLPGRARDAAGGDFGGGDD